jgi:two-component system NarL family sensor kinase
MDGTNAITDEIAFLVGTSIMFLMSFGIVMFIYLYQRKLSRKNRENQQIERLLQQQEMKTAYALMEGQDAERKRIAAELHDNLGSILVTLNMYADALSNRTNPDEIKDVAARISKTTGTANALVRELSHSLDSGILKHFGLESAINQLFEAVNMSKRMEAQSSLSIESKLTNEQSIELYRIIQELLNNALKHSKGTLVRLDLSVLDTGINMIFEDNGVGFDGQISSSGLGLGSIKNRIERLSGSLEIASTSGKGTTFIADIPIR